ncbi:MAG: thioredoxin [Haloferacaceae archaeon]
MTETEASETPTVPQYVGSAEEFREQVAENHIVFVDFYADWCGPCKMLEPIVEDLAAETPATVLKVDVDEQQELAAQFQIRGVPTTALFVDGDAEEILVGVRGKDQYAGLIDRYAN